MALFSNEYPIFTHESNPERLIDASQNKYLGLMHYQCR